MAVAVIKGAEEFGAQAKVQGQILAGFPVVLNENTEIVIVILVTREAAAAKTELRRAEQEILEVGVAVRRVGEKEFAVENLGKILIEIHDGHFTADTNDVSALDPADSIDDGNVVLRL